jgi:hypothetical protein
MRRMAGSLACDRGCQPGESSVTVMMVAALYLGDRKVAKKEGRVLPPSVTYCDLSKEIRS